MPGTESQIGVDQPPGHPAAGGAGDLAQEEGLANALSAFLAQLHSGLDDSGFTEPSGYVANPPAAKDEVRILPLEENLPFGRPVVGTPPLAHRKAVAPKLPGPAPATPPAPTIVRLPSVAGKDGTGPEPVGEKLPRPPLPAASATRNPQVDGWPAQSAISGIGLRPAPGKSDPRPHPAPPEPRLAPTPEPQLPAAPRPSPTDEAPSSPDVPEAPAEAGHEASRHRHRGRAFALVMAAVVLAAGLGAWGYSKDAALNRNSQRLAATQSALAATRSSLGQVQANLAGAQRLVRAQKADIRTANTWIRALRADIRNADSQITADKSQLTRIQATLVQTEGQLVAAQSEIGRTQGQLADIQQNLSATQSHATQWQQNALVAQKTVQVLSSLILLENDYLTAAQAKDAWEMQQDLVQMRTLAAEAQTLRPEVQQAPAQG